MANTLGDDIVAEAREAAEGAIEVDDGEEVKDGAGILAIMNGGGVDMQKLVIHFKELFKKTAFMGGEKAITSARMDDMSHKDLRKMIGVYAENFILD